MILDEFRNQVYAIPKNQEMDEPTNKQRQIHFFQLIYQLLFGEKSGPQLAPFLLEVDQKNIDRLLDI